MRTSRICEAGNCIALATHGSVCAVHAKRPSAGSSSLDTAAFLKLGINYGFRPESYRLRHDGEWTTIATIALNNALSTLVAIEARAREDGAFDIRVSDDEDGEYSWSPQQIQEPLCFRELIEFIERAEGPAGRGLVFGVLEANAAAGAALTTLATFITVDSNLYPDLSRHYGAEVLLWVEKRQRASR